MTSKKDRRHSGRVTPNIIKPNMKWDEIKINALKQHWNDWADYRDGFRDHEKLKRKIREMEK